MWFFPFALLIGLTQVISLKILRVMCTECIVQPRQCPDWVSKEVNADISIAVFPDLL